MGQRVTPGTIEKVGEMPESPDISGKKTEGEFLTVSDVATSMGVSTRTVVRWAESGELPVAFRTVGQHRRFSREAVEAFIASHAPTDH